MTREDRARDISIICGKCGCSEEQQKRHYRLFVNEGWQPHASKRFQKWWYAQTEYIESKDEDGIGIAAAVAQNVARIWEKYLEAKEVGVA